MPTSPCCRPTIRIRAGPARVDRRELSNERRNRPPRFQRADCQNDRKYRPRNRGLAGRPACLDTGARAANGGEMAAASDKIAVMALMTSMYRRKEPCL